MTCPARPRVAGEPIPPKTARLSVRPYPRTCARRQAFEATAAARQRYPSRHASEGPSLGLLLNVIAEARNDPPTNPGGDSFGFGLGVRFAPRIEASRLRVVHVGRVRVRVVMSPVEAGRGFDDVKLGFGLDELQGGRRFHELNIPISLSAVNNSDIASLGAK